MRPKTWAGSIGYKAQQAKTKASLNPEACDEEIVCAYLEDFGPVTPAELVEISGLTRYNVFATLLQLNQRGLLNEKNGEYILK
jgi:DNA-binding MarR family transcriptional regulator